MQDLISHIGLLLATTATSIVAIFNPINTVPPKTYTPTTLTLSQQPTSHGTNNEKWLWTLINNWEISKGYQPYIENSTVCEATTKVLDSLSANWNNIAFTQITAPYNFSTAALNSSSGMYTGEEILNLWLTSESTKKNFTDYYKYSCVRCSFNVCVQLLANFQSPTVATAPPRNGQQNNPIGNTGDPDPVVDCPFQHIGTKKLKSSVCTKSTECQLETDGDWYYFDSVESCKSAQTDMYNKKMAIIGDIKDGLKRIGDSYKPIDCVVGGTTYKVDQTWCYQMQINYQNAQQNVYQYQNTTPNLVPYVVDPPMVAGRQCNITDVSGCTTAQKEELRKQNPLSYIP